MAETTTPLRHSRGSAGVPVWRAVAAVALVVVRLGLLTPAGIGFVLALDWVLVRCRHAHPLVNSAL
ncbi:MAG TPA: hypothetical protein VMH35_06765 [Streptosporangiaceae bacterium]|nr:hypothetical protein [Streptosporangiaceae bacterium]